ncbi:MAG TPA: phosphoribosyltransferase family protein [Halomicronema sp.]
MADLFISWPDYHHSIEQLAAKIYQSHWQFNQIVCIARGGLRVGDIISRIYDLPLAILSASSYGGSGGQIRGEITIANHLSMTTSTLGSHVLLVDDLVDSGVSLQQTLKWLKSHYSEEIKEVRSAVLWYKACSIIQPDYYVEYLPENPWIHQPFEQYEKMKPEELVISN